MSAFSNEELELLLADVESDRIERKEAWAGDVPNKARQVVCAFANDLPNYAKPGVLIIGARDDGTPANIAVTDQLLTTLADMKTDGKIVPPPTLSVETRTLRGAQMAVVTVWPADAPPVRYDGRIWIRIGARRGIASAQDERILNEKRQAGDRSFDTQPIRGCPLDELSRLVFENEYLPRAVAADVLAANERSYEQRLAATGMIASVDDPTPTVVGVLTLGKSPRTWIPCAYIQFLRIQGTAFTDPILDAAEIDGTIDQMLRRIEEKVQATLATAIDFTSADREIRTSPYPITALQQIVRNAVMHRTYEHTNAPVRVYWFDDRIEVLSPGGPYGIVTAQNFGQPGVADYRNPTLAGALKTLGFVQRFGFGIGEARRALAANGNPPLEFQVEPTMVLFILRRAP